MLIGYDQSANQYFMDRTNSGKVRFEKGFASRHTVPRFTSANNVEVTLIIDNASVEMFADNGLSVMTQIFFPNALYTNINIQSSANFNVRNLTYSKMNSIWK